MCCNETNEDINEVAESYFANPTEAGKQKLIEMMYKDGSLKSILLNALGKACEEIRSNDLDDIKHNVYLKLERRVFEDKIYSPENGNFINYLRYSFKQDCKNEILCIMKEKSKIVSSVNENEDGEESDVIEELPSNYILPHDETIQFDSVERIRSECLKTLNYFYKLTKAGQKNKGLVCIFILQDVLMLCADERFEDYLRKYSFLKDNEDLLRSMKKSRKEYNAAEFSNLTGIAESKISSIKPTVMDFMKENLKQLRNMIE